MATISSGVAAEVQEKRIFTNQSGVFTIIEENDLIVRTDRHYTQGIKLSYLQADGVVPRVAERMAEMVPSVAYKPDALKFGFQIGQSMFTPANIRTTALIPNDRPYAGWLYTGLILQRRGETDGRTPVLENFAIDLGIVGPDSLAEQAQTWVHEVRGIRVAKGWAHQLKDEPGINLKYERSQIYRTSWRDGFAIDLVPRAGFSLGTVDTSLRAGGMVRIGWNLPGNFGVQTVDSITTSEGGVSPDKTTGRWGIVAFAGTEGRAVLHNTFLDGNLFHNSPHVTKEYLTGEFRTGFTVRLNRCVVGYTHVFRTPEFRRQPEADAYGSVFGQVLF